MFQKFSLASGAVFCLIGIMGLIPGITENGLLLDFFRIDLVLSLVYITTGMLGLWSGSTSDILSKNWLQLFGVLFSLLVVLGFIIGDGKIFGLIVNNLYTTWLHLLLASLLLSLGFGISEPQKDPS
jgi:hypothetical protein